MLAQGAAALSDAELLGILLGSGQPGKNAVDLARRALLEFGSLHSLLDADLSAHKRLRSGFGPARYAALKAATELTRRALGTQLNSREEMSSPLALAQFFELSLRSAKLEVFAAVALDTHLRQLAYAELFHGTTDRSAVYVGEVVRFALKHRAISLAVAHNHPSGIAEPSPSDVKLTMRLRDALALVDVRLIDHFIVGNGTPTSFAQRGLL